MNDIHDQASLYVVDALDDQETAEFEAHLETCAVCRAEVDELREVTAALSEETGVEPPAGLRAAILAQVTDTPQSGVPGHRGASPEPAHTWSDTFPSAASTQQGPTEPPALRSVPAEPGPEPAPSRRRRWIAPAVAAASVVAAVGFGGWAVDNQRDADQASELAASAQEQADTMRRLMAADDMQAVSGEFTDGGTGKVVMSSKLDTAMFVANDLPDLPDGRVYEAWTIEGEPAPAGTFTADGPMTKLPETAFSAEVVAVTIEPEGGSDEPTTDPVFTVEMP